MNLFEAAPVEIRQDILEKLDSLRDLQSALISCSALFRVYRASRKLIRQRVFQNEILEVSALLPFDNLDDSETAPLTVALGRIRILEAKNPSDGLILRQGLWPMMVAYYQRTHGEQPSELLTEWSSGLAAAYRLAGDDKEANDLESQTLRLLCHQQVPQNIQSMITWLEATTVACARHGQQAHGSALCREMLKHLNNPDHDVGLAVIQATAILFGGTIVDVGSRTSLHETISRAWEALRTIAIESHSRGAFCYWCFQVAKQLSSAAVTLGPEHNIDLHGLEMIWRTVPIRSPAFEPWTRLFVQQFETAKKNRLGGLMKVWERIQEDLEDQGSFLHADILGWPREIIVEIRKQGRQPTKHAGGMAESLDFQSHVLRLLAPGDPHYYSLGRNLADAYLKSGNILAAVRIREEIWLSLTPSSSLYTSCGLALSRLYQKLGRDSDADEIRTKVRKQVGVQKSTR